MSQDLNPYGIRRATTDDIDALLLFVPQVLAETSVLPLSQPKVERLIERCVVAGGAGVAGIIDGPEDAQIDASVGLLIVEDDTSDEPYVRAAWCGLHPTVRKGAGTRDDPRAHYGRRLFEFSKWCHAALEQAVGRSMLMRFDLLTLQSLGPKMGLYQRNMPQIGASFAFVAPEPFKSQDVARIAA